MTARGLRIIAGRLKGRRLRVPSATEVRPTPARVREALFSMLAAHTARAVVLDAFAGSGALGFEALSRGAERVVFVEANRRVVTVLRASASDLGVERDCEVVEGRLPDIISGRSTAPGRSRQRLVGPFDLILADPPYKSSAEDRGAVLAALAAVLDADGVLVVERAARDTPTTAEGELRHVRSERYGNTAVDLYRRTGE